MCHILPTVGKYETIEEKNQRSIYIYFVHMVVKNSLKRSMNNTNTNIVCSYSLSLNRI